MTISAASPRSRRIRPGWRLLAGAFTIDGSPVNTMLLMSPDNRIVHRWVLDEIPAGHIEPRPAFRKFVHGVEILPDGSVIFAFDGGVSLQRFDRCSQRVWSRPGAFHHTVTFDERRESVWTLGSIDRFVNVDVTTGEVLREVRTGAMIAANPEVDILELRRKHPNDLGTNLRNTSGEWLRGNDFVWQGIVLHYNEVEPLSA